MKRILWTLIWMLITTVVCTAQTTLYFPQVANGQQPGGIVWTTAIAVTNPAATGTPAASGTITFTQDNGSAFNVSFTDEQGQPVGTGNSVAFQVAGGQTRFFISTAAGPLTVGFGTLSSNLPVAAAGVFIESQTLPQGGSTSVAQAGVAAVTPVARQSTVVVEDDSTDTGVAIANPGNASATVTFTLLDINGVATLPPVTTTLAAHGHTAQFVGQLFPSVAGKRFYGTMQITSSAPLVATALTFKNGGQFATLPVFTLTSMVNPATECVEKQRDRMA